MLSSQLLRLASHDLDVATSSITGHEFAIRFLPWVEAEQQRETGVAREKPTTISKISANPNQSKHLETAMARVYDYDVDFVQLRSESYAEGSRIPTIVLGTPEEDALRRDLTINALFYNVHTRSVEDWTQKGLGDLLDKPLIRTPLPALQTFLDDPLRILRCIRFAARLGFPLDPEIKQTVLRPEVVEALAAKVSRERIGIEVDKMLKADDPVVAFRHIHDFGLHALIFGLPSDTKEVEPMPAEEDFVDLPLRAAETLASLLSSTAGLPPVIVENVISFLSPADKRRLYLAAALTPWRGVTCLDKRKRVWAGEKVIADAVKVRDQFSVASRTQFSAADRTIVSRLFSASSRINTSTLEKLIASGLRSQNGASSDCDVPTHAGLLLRPADAHDPVNGVHWRTTIAFSLLSDALAAGSQGASAIGTRSELDRPAESRQRLRSVHQHATASQARCAIDPAGRHSTAR